MQPHKKIEVKEYIGTHKEKGVGWTSYYARFLTASDKLQVTHVSENQLNRAFTNLAQQVRTEAAMLQQSKEIADGLLQRVSATSYAIPQNNYLKVMI